MSLSASFNTFKSEHSSAASRNANVKRPPPSSAPVARSSTPASNASTDLKRKRPDDLDSVPFSQPAGTGSGREIMTQVVYAIDYLREKDRAITFNDIWNYLSIPQDQQQHRSELQRALVTHPKVEYNPKGLDGKPSFRFRPIHNVRSGDELKAYLQRQPTAAGVSVKELRDGWAGAIAEIEKQEKQGELLVTRNKKDNIPKMVWPNDPSLAVHVDDDFQNQWHKIRLPANLSDMRLELEKAGLTPTSQVKEIVKVSGAREKKRRINRKAGKSTNTHMAGILKDYSSTKR